MEKTDPDMLWGYAEIGDHLGLAEQAVKHRVRRGEIPVFKIGRTPCATKTGLNEWMDTKMASAPRKGAH